MARRVLCLESSGVLRSLLGKSLADRGWEVIACADLTELGAILDRGPLALVITAAILPSGDYTAVVRGVRGRTENAAVPIILFSSGVAESFAQTALQNGVTEVFLKNELAALEIYVDSLGDDSEGPPAASGRALVLDDDEAIALYMARILEGLGLTVERAKTVHTALALARSHHYDLFIADIVLGGVQSGNLFVRLLRQTAAYAASTPIIAISGFQDDARRLDALRAGADIFLAKPVNEYELVFHAQKLLAREAAVSRADPRAGEKAGVRFELSRRERDISRLVMAGLPDKRIAERLGISYWTVRSHVASVFRKCGVVNRVQLSSLLRDTLLAEGEPLRSEPVDPLPAYVLEGFQHGVMVTDRQHNIIRVNGAFTGITGYEAAEVLGKTPRLLHSGRHDATFYRDFYQALAKHGNWRGEIWNRCKDGGIVPMWVDIQRLPDGAPEGGGYVAVLSAITESGVDVGRLRHSALHDVLTGLANRTLLHDHGQQEIARAKRSGHCVAVLFLDLDHFKAVNDTYGHATGDELLCELAGRMQASFRDNDTLARYGGDEFAAVLPDLADRDAAMTLGRKVMAIFAEAVIIDGLEFKIGASVGISVYPDDGDSIDDLVARADRAMYSGKLQGGGQVRFFDQRLDASQGDLQVLDRELHVALDNGELELRLQPRVDVASRAVIGAEVRLCWRHPRRGVLLPEDFLPLAERSSLIVAIGDRLLREACATLQRLHAAGFPFLSVTVNISPRQVLSQGFVATVAAILARMGLPPACLQLTMSESIFLLDRTQAAEVLGQLAAMQISLALDDFGRDSSNLGHLKRLPIDTVKVAGDLIGTMDADAYSGAVTEAVVGVATSLGMKVVAEGVDSSERYALVRDLGCHYAQGSLFGLQLHEGAFLAALGQGMAVPAQLNA